MASFVEIPGAKIWYQMTGSGETIAQIHGAGFGHDNFASISPLLAKRFRVLDYDMRGYGLSDRPGQNYTIDVWADDLSSIMERLDIPTAHIHGTSMGGMVALKFASRYPEKTKSLTVGCSACKADQTMKLTFIGWQRMAKKGGMGSRLLAETIAIQALSRNFLDGPEGKKMVDLIQEVLEKNNDVEVFLQACQTLIDLDIKDEISRIRAPTLVMVGDQDIMTPLDQGPEGGGGMEIHRQIDGSTLKIIEGCGHTFLFEKPEESTSIISDFIEKLESP